MKIETMCQCVVNSSADHMLLFLHAHHHHAVVGGTLLLPNSYTKCEA